MRLRERLLEAGHAPVIFHANGVGGPGDGEARGGRARSRGVVDYTLSELANSRDGRHPRDGPRAAARRRPPRPPPGGRPGLLRLLQPGRAPHGARALPRPQDATSTTPSRRSSGCRRRRASSSAALVAERLAGRDRSGARRRPRRAASRSPTREGGDAVGPGGRPRVPRRAARRAARPASPSRRSTLHVDDAEFADLVADRYLALVTEPAGVPDGLTACRPPCAARRSSSASSATAACRSPSSRAPTRVSPITVHRDLEELAREGLVERVHGGARALGGTAAARRSRRPGRSARTQAGAAKAAIARTPRATSTTARRSSSTPRRPCWRSPGGSRRSAERADARDQLARDRLRDAGRRDPRRRRAPASSTSTCACSPGAGRSSSWRS